MTNLQEYVFATDPLVSDVELLPGPHVVGRGAERFLAISYEWPTGELARTDIPYDAGTGTDLQHWASEGILTDYEAADQEVTERVTACCEAEAGRGIGYLRVVMNQKESLKLN